MPTSFAALFSRPAAHSSTARSELSKILERCRHAFWGVGAFSCVVNILMLTGPLFMLQVYDRVLTSRSVPTLVALGGMVLVLYMFQGFLDALRNRLLGRIGRNLDASLSERVYGAVVELALRSRGKGDGLQPIRDLDQVRVFLSSPGPAAFFDLPWMPFYLGVCFLFHPWIGIAAVGGAVILFALTLTTELATRAPARVSAEFATRRLALAAASHRNAEALRALGMESRLAGRWNKANAAYQESQAKATDITGGLGSASRTIRMLLQSAVLGLAAYLAIHQEISAGVIVAASILVSRAVAPVEQTIAHWRSFMAARQSWRRLDDLLESDPIVAPPLALPAPRSRLELQGVSASAPGSGQVIVQDVRFALDAGEGLGVIGPSAAGKSSLARLLVGVWQPLRGRVRLDGAALEQWDPDALGQHIGYLPQNVELFDGTVSENIARFDPDATPEAIIAAAQTACVHDLILALPNGYETPVGEGGAALSAGQRQRIALARALLGDPFLVVLDEPNSNLDTEGEQALTNAMFAVRQRGGIVIVIAHRPSALAAADKVLVMARGRQQAFGPKDEVLRSMLKPQGDTRKVARPQFAQGGQVAPGGLVTQGGQA